MGVDPALLIPIAYLLALQVACRLGGFSEALLFQVRTTSPGRLVIFDGAIAVGDLDVDSVGVGAGGPAGEDLAVLGSGGDLAGLGGGSHDRGEG